MQVQSTFVSAVNPGAAAETVASEAVELKRVNLRSLIEKQNGKFVSVDFIKLDNTIRTLTGRLSVKAYLKGGQNTVMRSDRPYLTVFDVQLRQYRVVNLDTVHGIRAGGVVYRVLD